MRRLLCTIPLLLLSLNAYPQELRHTHSEAFRRPALDVAIDDEMVWIADGYGVTVATRETPPALVSSRAFPGDTSHVVIDGGDAWIVSGTTLFRASWDGKTIVLKSSRELGETVFDIVASRGFLYLATRSGVVQIDTAIEGSRTVLNTTAGLAISLATDGSTLLAADGDNTVEVYTIEFPVLPQKIGVAEHSIAGANRVYDVSGNLLVSNGRESQLFGSLRPPFTSLGTLSFGASTAAVSSPGIVFAAGLDTTVRTIDLRLSAGRPAILFEDRIPPSGGTINRISRIRSDGNRVYVAAGDLGLQTYDIVDFGVPFPVVRSFVDRADSVVDLGTGQIVAARRDGPPRLYSIDQSGALREVTRWQDQAGVTLLDHWNEVTIVAQAGTVRLVRPSASVVGQFSFGAAVSTAVVVGDQLWLTLADRTLWKVALTGGAPEKIQIAGANPSWLARGAGRIVLGSLNDDGTTTLHQIDPANPAASPSMTIPGLATSGGGVNAAAVAVATFRGLSILNITTATERVYALGEGMVPRSIEMTSDEVIILGSEKLHRRAVSDGSLIAEVTLLSSGLSVSAEEGSGKVAVGAAEGVYLLDLQTDAVQPVRLERLRKPLFFEDIVGSDGHVHLVEGETIHSGILQNQSLTGLSATTAFATDLLDVTATPDGFCGLDSVGHLDCFDSAGRATGGGDIAALDDATFLSVHAAHDTVLVSLLEGCFGSGCRKRTVFGTISAGTFHAGGQIEGEVLALDQVGSRLAVVTDLPKELRLYDLAASSSDPVLVAATPLTEKFFSVAMSEEGGTIYVAGEKLKAFAAPSMIELGEVLPPLDPAAGLTALDQGVEIEGDQAYVIGRSSSLQVYRMEAPGIWSLERTIALPSTPRQIIRDGATVIVLTDFSIELFSLDPPLKRRRAVR